MSFGIRPVGIYTDTPIEDDPGLKDLDLDGIEILGEAWGEIDVEKAAELAPDLIVADWWPVDEAYSGVEDGVKEESKKIAELAPMVGASQGDSAVSLIEGYEELAKSLGADLESDTVRAAKERFDDAIAEFRQATASKPGLDALAVSPSTDLLYVAVPEHAPELLDFQRWGLDVIVPDNPDKAFPYWENLSWENADKYQPDLLLIDDRSYPANLKQAERQPTWETIDAAVAGAIIPWPGYWVHTYDDYAEQLEALSAEIEQADPDIGA
jgi:iron complex transport system substrate-binding protein